MLFTPIPYPYFPDSIACYTDFTLHYVLEGLLNNSNRILSEEEFSRRWRHATVSQWHSNKDAFIVFLAMCYSAAKERGMIDDIPRAQVRALDTIVEHRPTKWRKPLWVHWDAYQLTSRRYVYHYGNLEAICNRVAAHLNIQSRSLFHRLMSTQRWLGDSAYCGDYTDYYFPVDDTSNLLTERGFREMENPYTLQEWTAEETETHRINYDLVFPNWSDSSD